MKWILCLTTVFLLSCGPVYAPPVVQDDYCASRYSSFRVLQTYCDPNRDDIQDCVFLEEYARRDACWCAKAIQYQRWCGEWLLVYGEGTDLWPPDRWYPEEDD